MGKFLNGLFVGIGVGLFIAPQNGKEMRRLIMERLAALRKSMPSEDDQHFSINASPPQIATFPLEPDQPITTSSSEPLEQITSSVAPADTEQMGKSSTLSNPSNMSGQTARRKASTRTSSTSKTRGHNK